MDPQFEQWAANQRAAARGACAHLPPAQQQLYLQTVEAQVAEVAAQRRQQLATLAGAGTYVHVPQPAAQYQQQHQQHQQQQHLHQLQQQQQQQLAHLQQQHQHQHQHQQAAPSWQPHAAPHAAPPPAPPAPPQPPPAAPPAAPPSAPAPAAKWPASCERWASSLFDYVKTQAHDRALALAVQGEIFAVVNRASKDGTLFARDWDAEPPVPAAIASMRARGLPVPNDPAAREAAAAAEAAAASAARRQQQLQQVAALQAKYSQQLQAQQQQAQAQAHQQHQAQQHQAQQQNHHQPHHQQQHHQHHITSADFGGAGGFGAAAPRGSAAIQTWQPGVLSGRQQAAGKRGRDATGSNSLPLGAGGAGGAGGDAPAGEGGPSFAVVGLDAADGADGAGGRLARKAAKAAAARSLKSAAALASTAAASAERLSRFAPSAAAAAAAAASASNPFSHPQPSSDPGGAVDISLAQAVVGTCLVVEKSYFRLIGPPDPAEVRPEPVLRAALELVQRRSREGAKYLYLSDQLKSIRQDLSVQHLRGALTLEVYQSHARLALENGDPSEFNQSLTQLERLFKEHRSSSSSTSTSSSSLSSTSTSSSSSSSSSSPSSLSSSSGAAAPSAAAPEAALADLSSASFEYAAYRVLYSLYTADPTDAKAQLARLSRAECENAWVRHALAVAAAVSADNAARFFALYRSAPNFGSFLMDWLGARVRSRALAALCKGAQPSLPLSFLVRALGFDSVDDARSFLARCGGVVLERGGAPELDCKASVIVPVKDSLAAQQHADLLSAGTRVVALAAVAR